MDECISFWQRVEYLLEAKGLTKKELAQNVHITASSISKGLQENRFPSAQTAVEIARYLDTTVEYLVTGEDCNFSPPDEVYFDRLIKYSRTIRDLDSLPEKARKSIEIMISSLSQSNPSVKNGKK